MEVKTPDADGQTRERCEHQRPENCALSLGYVLFRLGPRGVVFYRVWTNRLARRREG